MNAPANTPTQPDFAKVHSCINNPLRAWGRSRTVDYRVFTDMAKLGLFIVEEEARKKVSGPLIDHDLQKACWRLIEVEIRSMRPDRALLTPEENVTLDRLTDRADEISLQISSGPYPLEERGRLRLPSECHPFVFLYLAYVDKYHDNLMIAKLLGLSVSTLMQLRRIAINQLCAGLYQKELAVRSSV